jgi:plasmid stabilization system protein ParE
VKVVWTRRAIINLAEISTYLQTYDKGAADRIVDDIERCVTRLTEFPFRGRIGRRRRTRELVIPRTPYIVAYRLDGDNVLVLAVVHGARRWPTRFS